MTTTVSQAMDVTVTCEVAGREMVLTVSPRKRVRDVLRASAARFHVLSDAGGIDQLQIRRVGELVPLDVDLLAEDALVEGDRLIVEPTPGSASTPPQEDLSTVAGRIVGELLSSDSRTFLRHARQTVGE